VLVVTEERQATASFVDPKALIEEARERQRRRRQRGRALLGAVAILAVVGCGGFLLARGDGTVGAGQRGRAAAAGSARPTVTYEKRETLKIAPGLPAERRTSEIWSAANAPLSYRELLSVTGGPTVEIGAGRGHDETLGTVQDVYLFDPTANAIYRTGYYDVSTRPQWALRLSTRRFFRLLIAQNRVRVIGTQRLGGRSVYVVRSRRGTLRTDYIDTQSYLPVKSVIQDGDATVVMRTLVRKTLPATKANLARTRLSTAHPGARVEPAPTRIDELYGKALGGFLTIYRTSWRELILYQTAR